MIIVNSLQECIELESLYDKIIIDTSYGREYKFIYYNSLGLGNLITPFIGANCISGCTGGKEIISPLQNRIRPAQKNIFSWYARSDFGLDVPKKIIQRLYYRDSSINNLLSYIDNDRKVLHLSTHLVNVDMEYLKTVKANEIYFDYLGLKKAFNINVFKGSKLLKRHKKNHIGLHIRRGDFSTALLSDKKNTPNTSPDISFYTNILHKLESFGFIDNIVTIYSDQSYEKINRDIAKFPQNNTYKISNPYNSASAIINDMMTCDILVQSNSTLSTWAGILSGMVSIYPNDSTPYSAHLYFENFISDDNISKSNFLNLKSISK
jgi:hypothetical protein